MGWKLTLQTEILRRSARLDIVADVEDHQSEQEKTFPLTSAPPQTPNQRERGATPIYDEGILGRALYVKNWWLPQS